MPQKNRAYLQEWLADLVIDFQGWDDMRCNTAKARISSKEELIKIIGEQNIQRYLVVIIMGKRYLNDTLQIAKKYSLEKDIIELEKIMKDAGFTKVIFQQASSALAEPTGRFIIKE